MGTVKEKGEKTKDKEKIKIKGQKLSKKGAWAVNFGLSWEGEKYNLEGGI